MAEQVAAEYSCDVRHSGPPYDKPFNTRQPKDPDEDDVSRVAQVLWKELQTSFPLPSPELVTVTVPPFPRFSGPVRCKSEGTYGGFTFPRCGFLQSELEDIHSLVQLKPEGGFKVAVMDPPWHNKSVKRSKKYNTLEMDRLLELPINQLMHDDRVIAVWVTNDPRVSRYVLEVLFPAWGVELSETIAWVKVATTGQPLMPFGHHTRKPFEKVLVGSRQKLPMEVRTVVGVPLEHSQKPYLDVFLRRYCEDVRGVEFFARNLRRGWVSWGNECLHRQSACRFGDLPPLRLHGSTLTRLKRRRSESSSQKDNASSHRVGIVDRCRKRTDGSTFGLAARRNHCSTASPRGWMKR